MSSEAAPADVAAVAPPADRLADLKAARQALKRQLAQATREVKSQDIDWWPSDMVMSCLGFPSQRQSFIHAGRYGHLPVISTYNPIYRMYNPIYNQL